MSVGLREGVDRNERSRIGEQNAALLLRTPRGHFSSGYSQRHAVKKDEHFKGVAGGANRDRTDDLLNAIQTLSQLSYGPTQERGI